MSRGLFFVPALCLVVAACQPQTSAPVPATPQTVPAVNGEDSGAVSSDVKPVKALQVDVLEGTHWPPMRLTSGEARISCDRGDATDIIADDAGSVPDSANTTVPAALAPEIRPGRDAQALDAPMPNDETPSPGDAGDTQAQAQTDDADGVSAAVGDDRPVDDADGSLLGDLDFADVSAAMTPCRERGLVRLHYTGKIGGDFTALVQRIAAMADRLRIEQRILDIDSTGGRVEDAMPAGDAIAESHWSIRVRSGAICHSACVLVLAAGDERAIEGRIGIHRMIRVGSKADTRADLSQELREVYGEMKDYLERNGASAAVADLMMTVPNRSLRLLTENELREYGLSGANAVQDDLDRIRLTRRCGEDFVKRKDAYRRAFESKCASGLRDAADTEACAQPLRERYGFPDETCPSDGPLAVVQ